MRLLPWLQEALRSEHAQHAYMQNCDKCMANHEPQTRRALGCGFEPALDDATPMHPLQYPGDVTVCPGYSTRLPEVLEVATGYLHWEKGTLRDRFDGLAPTPALLDGLETLQQSVRELEAKKMAPKGGA